MRAAVNDLAAKLKIASDAVQVTVVVPAENPLPDAGVHEVCTGAVPPAVAGTVHVMATG